MHWIEQHYGNMSAAALATETGVSLLSGLTLVDLQRIPISDADRLRLIGQLWDELERANGEASQWEQRILPLAIEACEALDTSSSTDTTEPIVWEDEREPCLGQSRTAIASVDSGSPDQGVRATRDTPSVSPPRSPQGWNVEKGLSVGRELHLSPRSSP